MKPADVDRSFAGDGEGMAQDGLDECPDEISPAKAQPDQVVCRVEHAGLVRKLDLLTGVPHQPTTPLHRRPNSRGEGLLLRVCKHNGVTPIKETDTCD